VVTPSSDHERIADVQPTPWTIGTLDEINVVRIPRSKDLSERFAALVVHVGVNPAVSVQETIPHGIAPLDLVRKPTKHFFVLGVVPPHELHALLPIPDHVAHSGIVDVPADSTRPEEGLVVGDPSTQSVGYRPKPDLVNDLSLGLTEEIRVEFFKRKITKGHRVCWFTCFEDNT
jgi:hypothetical protein